MSANVHKWNFYKLFAEVLCDRLTCLTWCKENGLLPSVKTCSEGHIIVVTEAEIRKVQFTSGDLECTREHHDGHKKTVVWWKGSWFENSNFTLAKTLMMTYCFSRGLTSTAVIRECSSATETISIEDVVKYYHFCRELVADYILQNQDLDGQLGGEEQVIEVYESKFGLRKYNRSKMKRGTHVICLVEKNSRRFRVITCPAREQGYEAMLGIIQENIAEGSTIFIDECSEYRELTQSYTFLPQTVKSEILVNLRKRGLRAEDATYAKKNKGVGNNKALGDELIEHVWRREMKFKKRDNFECFLEIIRCYFNF